MWSIPPSVKIYLYAQDADLRRGYDGLASIVQQAMGEDPLSGSLYLFINKRCNRIKILYWDRDGYAIWMKRIERGCLERPRASDEETRSIRLTASQLSLILEGIELSSVRRRPRYQLPVAG